MLNLFRHLKRGTRVLIGLHYLRLVSQKYQRCERLEEFFNKCIQQFVKIVIYVLQDEGNVDDNNIILLRETIIKNYEKIL